MHAVIGAMRSRAYAVPGNTAIGAAGNDALALLASYGFKVAFGGIYCIDDYRAM